MAEFNTAMNLLPYNLMTRFEYKGINRTFFPKWGGWSILDSREVDTFTLDDLTYQFYNSYFWLKLKGSQIKDQNIANLLFIFATKHGKKKAVSKIQRLLKTNITGVMDEPTILLINNSKCLFLHLWAEYVEFCIVTGNVDFLNLMLPVYYKYEASLKPQT